MPFSAYASYNPAFIVPPGIPGSYWLKNGYICVYQVSKCIALLFLFLLCLDVHFNRISLPLLFLMFQMPIFISVFIGLRAMATLPVASMATGGVLWFTDLTIPDPYYILPILTSLTMLATIEVSH